MLAGLKRTDGKCRTDLIRERDAKITDVWNAKFGQSVKVIRTRGDIDKMR